MNIQEQIQQHLNAAKHLVGQAEQKGRDFSQAEREAASYHLAEAKRLKGQLNGAAKKQRDKEGDEALIKAVLELGSPSSIYNGRPRGPWGAKFRQALGKSGQKDLLPPSGSVTVGQMSQTIGTLDDEGRATTFLQMIPIVANGGDAFSYLRETTRTHRARPVAVGEKKPQSNYVLERIDDRIRTIAHLSEPIPRNWLSDAPNLENYVNMTLRAGVLLELEHQILQGSGLDEDLPGVTNVANVNVQPFVTNHLVTTRKAVTALELRPVTPSGWIMHPVDWEIIELSTASGSGEFLIESSPVDRARRRLWGLPVALTLGIDEGVALVADWRTAVTLHEREQTRIDWSEGFKMDATAYEENPGTGFQHNMVQFRGEGRWGLEINRPTAICEVTLSEGS
jgi:HK97 family phage major capsid protein